MHCGCVDLRIRIHTHAFVTHFTLHPTRLFWLFTLVTPAFILHPTFTCYVYITRVQPTFTPHDLFTTRGCACRVYALRLPRSTPHATFCRATRGCPAHGYTAFTLYVAVVLVPPPHTHAAHTHCRWVHGLVTVALRFVYGYSLPAFTPATLPTLRSRFTDHIHVLLPHAPTVLRLRLFYSICCWTRTHTLPIIPCYDTYITVYIIHCYLQVHSYDLLLLCGPWLWPHCYLFDLTLSCDPLWPQLCVAPDGRTDRRTPDSPKPQAWPGPWTHWPDPVPSPAGHWPCNGRTLWTADSWPTGHLQ